jgi:hypothetical protein
MNELTKTAQLSCRQRREQACETWICQDPCIDELVMANALMTSDPRTRQAHRVKGKHHICRNLVKPHNLDSGVDKTLFV